MLSGKRDIAGGNRSILPLPEPQFEHEQRPQPMPVIPASADMFLSQASLRNRATRIPRSRKRRPVR